jgi:hypothetical protein
MATPSGFSYSKRKNGDVVITHNGKNAATLRGAAAERFLVKLGRVDNQQLMARATGNYRRGTEKRSRKSSG